MSNPGGLEGRATKVNVAPRRSLGEANKGIRHEFFLVRSDQTQTLSLACEPSTVFRPAVP
jgi:hypothetical protein